MKHRVALLLLLVSVGPANAGSTDCTYDNLFPDIAAGSIPSQHDPFQSGDPVFFAEAADDFVLDGTPGNPCDLESVSFAVRFFNTPPGAPVDPMTCWSGVVITIYEDIGAGTPGADPNCNISKGPAGYPDDDALPDIGHVECFPGAVVCVMEAGVSQVTATEIDFNSFEVTVSGLTGRCALEKDRKYWIAIAPVQNFFQCGQTGIMISTGSVDHPAMRFFAQMNVMPWSPVGGDLALRVVGARPFPPFCPADTDGDLDVDVDDLNSVILDWGTDGSAHGGDITDATGTGPPDGLVNVNDLNAVIVGWGPCPAPANDDCSTAQPVVVAVDPASPSVEVPLDMRGATAGLTPITKCVPPGPDVWFSLDYTGNNAGVYVIFTEPDLFVEVYDSCVCHPGAMNLLACGWGQDGVFVDAIPGVFPRCVRVINAAGIPNDELTGTVTVEVNAPPDNDQCHRRIPIVEGSTPFDTGLASIDPADPPFSCAGVAEPARDIWFNYTAPFDGFLFLDTNGSTFDTLLEVYDGFTCPPIASLGCDDDSGDGSVSALNVPVAAGQEIKIRVGGNRSGGPGTLTVHCIESFAPSCTGSDYAQRPHEPGELFAAATSDVSGGFLVYDDFPWAGGDVTSLWFYGFDAFFAGQFLECDEANPLFDVFFFADDGSGTQPGALLSQVIGVPAVEKNPMGVYEFGGTSFQGWQYKVTFPARALPPSGSLRHWVAIRGATPGDNCWFLWVSSPDGDGEALQEDGQGILTPIGDRAFCVNRD